VNYPREQLGFWLEKRFVQFVKKNPFGRKKWSDLVFVLRAAKREKSEGDSQHEDEDKEDEEDDETNYTSSREVEIFFFAVKDHQPFCFF